MRGTRNCRSCCVPSPGIIPAYAGNTRTRIRWQRGAWDHPRVCGEHSFRRTDRCCAGGSSPRMRGTPTCRVSALLSGGIIPAYAGNTPALTALRDIEWDHPRVCGEHLQQSVGGVETVGSSPRMRGTRYPLVQQSGVAGIIPAYAGNTGHGLWRCVWCEDHPRVCGEHLLLKQIVRRSKGSSPRMRGTLLDRD